MKPWEASFTGLLKETSANTCDGLRQPKLIEETLLTFIQPTVYSSKLTVVIREREYS